jgi:hypothetical protein
MSYLLLARAVTAGGGHYCEIHDVRERRLNQRQRSDLETAMRYLLRATTLEPVANIEVGIAELPYVDGDYEEIASFNGLVAGGLLLPNPREAKTDG